MREAILVPNYAEHKKDPQNPCPCQDIPVKLTYKKGIIIWIKNVGDHVCKDEPVCEAEVEKATLELCSPCDGTLIEKCILDNMEFTYGQVLGYIEEDPQ